MWRRKTKMRGVNRFLSISESADNRINELLDTVESLGIEWSSDELDDEGLALSGF